MPAKTNEQWLVAASVILAILLLLPYLAFLWRAEEPTPRTDPTQQRQSSSRPKAPSLDDLLQEPKD